MLRAQTRPAWVSFPHRVSPPLGFLALSCASLAFPCSGAPSSSTSVKRSTTTVPQTYASKFEFFVLLDLSLEGGCPALHPLLVCPLGLLPILELPFQALGWTASAAAQLCALS